MALSMDEQRMLAEIERRLAAEDPGLAVRLSSFKRPGPAAKLRAPRAKLIGSLVTVVLVVVISLTVYAMIPFRAHGPKSTATPLASSGRPGVSASVKPGSPSSAAAKTSAPAKASTATNATRANAATTKAATTKAATSKTASRAAALSRTSTHTASTAPKAKTTAHAA